MVKQCTWQISQATIVALHHSLCSCSLQEPEAHMQDNVDTESLTNLARDANFQAFVLQSSLLYLSSCKGQLPLLAIIAGVSPPRLAS
jgi:hypothetical protein